MVRGRDVRLLSRPSPFRLLWNAGLFRNALAVCFESLAPGFSDSPDASHRPVELTLVEKGLADPLDSVVPLGMALRNSSLEIGLGDFGEARG